MLRSDKKEEEEEEEAEKRLKNTSWQVVVFRLPPLGHLASCSFYYYYY